MKLVIQTQYKENYGAHDWDGKGECPQYWKFKGGETFVVRNVDNKDLVPALRGLIEYSDDHQEEYILSTDIMEDDAVCCESWETPWDIHVEEMGFYASRYVKAEDYWTPGYAGKATSYKMKPGGERESFQEAYIKLEAEVA
jgi:hypothetical protein